MSNWKTIPNCVTTLGILLAFGYTWTFLNHKNDWVLPLLVSASFTDFLDGFLARRLNQRSRVGFFLDPIRDKILFVSVYVNLCLIYSEYPRHTLGTSVLLAGIATLEIRNAIVLWQKRLPQSIHWLGKVRSFIHFSCGSTIVASHYIHWPISDFGRPSWRLCPMLIASYLARTAYMFRSSRAEMELDTWIQQHQAPKPSS